MTTAHVLLAVLAALAAFFAWHWFRIERAGARAAPSANPGVLRLAIGFVTNFFDTLGIGSFAPTTAAFKVRRLVADEWIPGTLNVGHTLPTIAQGLIFIGVVRVGPATLVSMMAASAIGAWLGAGVVARLPRRAIQIGMGAALSVAAILFALMNLKLMPSGGVALELTGATLVVAVAINFVLGALMTLGIGLYAPCLILVSLLGMNPLAAFPIMMGSCAVLMPVASLRFIQNRKYDLRAALGLALGGIPAVLLAAYVVRSLPLDWLRWLVVVVVLYAAALMLLSARAKSPAADITPQTSADSSHRSAIVPGSGER
ncbi:MAG TPA: sulfite exporter TauE/SafE family protein [Steroidobacteraceae bacterium]|nr:sulfite exporter TauE/SafE family protein [Steroidobacteraceae bacterium]